jgi:hypothetical protein
MPVPRILVIDGHDGAGKSSLAGLVARRLGWAAARPFTGAVSAAFYRCLARDDPDQLHAIARRAVARLEALHPGGVVFDRHWLTMLSVLPPSLHGRWLPPPPTLLCWTDPVTTLHRVSARGETRRNDLDLHRAHCALFLEHAQRHGIPVLDTTRLTPRRALEHLQMQHPRLLSPWI